MHALTVLLCRRCCAARHIALTASLTAFVIAIAAVSINAWSLTVDNNNGKLLEFGIIASCVRGQCCIGTNTLLEVFAATDTSAGRCRAC